MKKVNRNRPRVRLRETPVTIKTNSTQDKDEQGVMGEVATPKWEDAGGDRTSWVNFFQEQSVLMPLLPLRVNSVAFSKELP